MLKERVSERCGRARHTVRAGRPAGNRRCWGGGAAGSGAGNGQGSPPAPHRPQPPLLRPHAAPPASRHRDGAGKGTGSREEGLEAQGSGGGRGTRNRYAAVPRRSGNREPANSAPPSRPHATPRGRRALSLTPSIYPSIHPSIHAPTGRAARTSPAPPGSAKMAPPPLPPRPQRRGEAAPRERFRPASAACARTHRAGRSGAGTPRRRDPAPFAAAAPARAARAPVGARVGLTPRAVRRRFLPCTRVRASRLSQSEGAV